MAWCKLEDSARHHFKFNRLAEALRIHRAEARGLFLGLCSWATVSAPDGLLIGFTHRDIENGADWQGKPGRLVDAMIAVGLIDQGAEGILEIHDFFERAESHKQAVKKRTSRDRTRTVPGQSPDCTAERRGEEKRGKEKKREERAADDSLAEVSSAEFDQRHLAAGHPEVQFFEADYRQRFGGPSLSKLERARAAEIIRRCAEAQTPWRDVMDFYARGFEFSGHTLDWLRDHFREVLNKMGRKPDTDDPEPAPWADDWTAWAERQKAKKR